MTQQQRISLRRINQDAFCEFLEPYRERVIEFFGDARLIDDRDRYEVHYGAFIDDELCAVCSLVLYSNPNEWVKFGVDITNCFTAPKHERKGCLTAMINKAKEVAKALDCSLNCTALTETSMKVFEREGFVFTGKPMVAMRFLLLDSN